MSNVFRLAALGILAAFGGAMILASAPDNPAGSTDSILSAGNAAVIGVGILVFLAGGKTANEFMRGGR